MVSCGVMWVSGLGRGLTGAPAPPVVCAHPSSRVSARSRFAWGEAALESRPFPVTHYPFSCFQTKDLDGKLRGSGPAPPMQWLSGENSGALGGCASWVPLPPWSDSLITFPLVEGVKPSSHFTKDHYCWTTGSLAIAEWLSGYWRGRGSGPCGRAVWVGNLSFGSLFVARFAVRLVILPMEYARLNRNHVTSTRMSCSPAVIASSKWGLHW